MKQLNFTAKEILLSLLNKSKTQTIRKAWKHSSTNTYRTPPKYEVGDEVELIWDKDNPNKYFWKNNGKPVYKELRIVPMDIAFNKNLGKVKITEVFEIEMWKNENGYFRFKQLNLPWLTIPDNTAKQDGFKSAIDMFTYFDKKHDLSSSKKFHVYRWEWLK